MRKGPDDFKFSTICSLNELFHLSKATKEDTTVLLNLWKNFSLGHKLLKDFFTFQKQDKRQNPHSSVLIYTKMVVSLKQTIRQYYTDK